jgi:hypothetical protein
MLSLAIVGAVHDEALPRLGASYRPFRGLLQKINLPVHLFDGSDHILDRSKFYCLHQLTHNSNLKDHSLWECSKRRHFYPLLFKLLPFARTQPRIGKTPKILPVAPLRRKLSGSRPGWRLAISFARSFAPAITSASLVRIEVSLSTGTPRLSQSIPNIFCCLLTASRLHSRRSCILFQKLPVLGKGRKEGSAYPAYDRAIIRAIRIDDRGGLAIGASQVFRHLMYTLMTLHNTDLSCIATTPEADGCSG